MKEPIRIVATFDTENFTDLDRAEQVIIAEEAGYKLKSTIVIGDEEILTFIKITP